MENASRHHTLEKVRHAIEKRTEKNGWEFIFLGANIDAVEAASGLGIGAERAANYTASPEGTRAMYDVVDAAVCRMRRSAPMNDSWKEGLEE